MKKSKTDRKTVKNNLFDDEKPLRNKKLPKDFVLSTVFSAFTEYPLVSLVVMQKEATV
jgi:hypothetical protein